jgi:hypothetical protein
MIIHEITKEQLREISKSHQYIWTYEDGVMMISGVYYKLAFDGLKDYIRKQGS